MTNGTKPRIRVGTLGFCALLGLLLALPSRAAKKPTVVRPVYNSEGRIFAGGTVFFLSLDGKNQFVAVGAAHSFDLLALSRSKKVEFRLGHSKRPVTETSRLWSEPGRPFSEPGSSFAEDLMLFDLDTPPKGVRILEPSQQPLRIGQKLRIFGAPSSKPQDEDVLVGTISKIALSSLEIDLDTPVDLRGWGGAPAITTDQRVAGLLQAAWPKGPGMRLGFTPIQAVLELASRPVHESQSSFELILKRVAQDSGSRSPTGTNLDPVENHDTPPLRGEPRLENVSDELNLILEIEFPPNDSIIGDSLGGFVSGKALALSGNFRRFDVIFVIDTSGSTAEMTGTDINDNGVVGERGLRGVFGHHDEGDSILAAEVSAAKHLLRGLDPRSTRIGLVTFSGDPYTGYPPRRSRAAAITEKPLTSDYGSVELSLDRLLKRGPEGMTHMAAGVDRATIELLGLRGGLSDPDPGSEKIVLFFTDGQPTLPYDATFMAENVKAVLRAADRSSRADITIHSFAIGPDALEGPIATVEMASRTDGHFTPVRHPGELDEVVDIVNFANVSRLTLKNLTTDSEIQELAITADGSWSSLVPLAPGRNLIRVTAYANDGSQHAQEITLQFAPDAPSPIIPRELLAQRNQLLEQRLIELRRASHATELQVAEQTRRELKLEIEKEREAARVRADNQRKELDLEIEPGIPFASPPRLF